MGNVPFTGNYEDLSSNRGFQFKFFCEKCGNGYLSSFQTNKLGAAASVASAAANLLGGTPALPPSISTTGVRFPGSPGTSTRPSVHSSRRRSSTRFPRRFGRT